MISPFNPRILLWSFDGKPAPKSIIKFFEYHTDVPKSVRYVEGGTLTQEIVADSSGEFAQVELLVGQYTLKGFVPIDPRNPYPLFPEDYELRSTWDLNGEEDPSHDESTTIMSLADLDALRNYDGDETQVLVANRLFIRDTYTSQTDNNGTVILSSALASVVWRMDLTGYTETSIEWFGADRTGTANSTAAFVSAISAIYNNSSAPAEYRLPRTLYIPDGVYTVNSGITFSCPVHMEKGVKFGNVNGSAVTFTFLSDLVTYKTDAMALNLAGYSPIDLAFTAGGKVNLGWFANRTIDMSRHQNPISVYGYGTINVDGNGHIIDLIQNEGSTINISIPSAAHKLQIDNIDCYENALSITGNGFVIADTLKLSRLASPDMVNRVHGHLLIIDEDWDVSSDVDTTWSMVEGEDYPTINNTSCTAHQVMFYMADVEWETMDAHVHDLVWVNKSEPKNMNWTNANSYDWRDYLVYGSNDFLGTTTSGDINLDSPSITLKNLNHTGTMWNFGNELTLDSCTVTLGNGQSINARKLVINDSNILVDDPANGEIASNDMRLRDSFIQCAVALGHGDNMQLEMRGCHFTNQISVSTLLTLQTLVIKNNEMALAEFVPYTIYCKGLSSTAKVSIDISDNWTTDTSGQLVRTKGFAKTTPLWNATGHFYYQTFSSLGVLDIRNYFSADRESFASNAAVHPYYVSGDDDDYTTIVTPYLNYVGAIHLVNLSGFDSKNITFDAWNTQDYGA